MREFLQWWWFCQHSCLAWRWPVFFNRVNHLLIIALSLQHQYFGQFLPSKLLQRCGYREIDSKRLSNTCSATPAWLSHSLTQTSLPIERCKRLLSVFAGLVFVDSEPLRGIPKLQLPDDVVAAKGMLSLKYSSFSCCIHPYGLAVASVWRRWRAKNSSTLSLFSFLKIVGQWGLLDPHHSPLYSPGVLESDWRMSWPILALKLVAGIQLRFELLQLHDLKSQVCKEDLQNRTIPSKPSAWVWLAVFGGQ